MKEHNEFTVVSKSLSKPFFVKNAKTNQIMFIVFAIIFVFVSIAIFTTEKPVFGFVFMVLGIWCAFGAVIIEKRFVLQSGNCPYCGKLIQMARKETRFKCPLCNRPIAKTKTIIENIEPLNQSSQSEPIIEFEEMRDNFFEKWGLSLQCNANQRKRLERARADTVYMLFDINPDNGTAGCYSSNYDTTGKIYDVTYKHCTCPDFEKRGLPCKHIYALNVNMNIIREEEDLSGISISVKEKMKQLTYQSESYFWSLLRRYDYDAFLIKRSRSSKPLLALELIKDVERNSVLLDKLFSRNDLVAKIYESNLEYKPSSSSTKFEIIDYLIENEPDFVKKIIKNDMLVVFDDEVMQCKQKICDYYLERDQSLQQQ